MGFKEKVNNYLEEQKRTEEAKRKAELEKFLQQEAEKEALLKEKIAEYQKEALPLIEALNKTPVKQWLEEIKTEEGQWQDAKIYLLPDFSDMEDVSDLPEDLYAEVKLTKIHYENHDVIHGANTDSEDRKEETFEYEDSIGIGAKYNEREIQFYSIFVYHTYYDDDNKYEEETICLNGDPECNQKIEKALIAGLSRLR